MKGLSNFWWFSRNVEHVFSNTCIILHLLLLLLSIWRIHYLEVIYFSNKILEFIWLAESGWSFTFVFNKKCPILVWLVAKPELNLYSTRLRDARIRNEESASFIFHRVHPKDRPMRDVEPWGTAFGASPKANNPDNLVQWEWWLWAFFPPFVESASP